MPNMEDLLNEIPTEVTRVRKDSLWISRIDLEYSCGELKLCEETSRHCNFAKTG